MSYVVSIRLPDKKIWERAKQYAKREGITIGRMVVKALEYYITREDRILDELKGIREELNRLEGYLEGIKVKPRSYEPSKPVVESKVEEYSLPSFIRDNPWVEILGKRGK